MISTAFVSLLVFQAILPLAYCLVVYAYLSNSFGLTFNDYAACVKWFMSLWTISLIGQMAQGAVLLIGILKIKRLITEFGWNRMVNHCAFALHFGIFSLYFLMMVLLFIKGAQYFIDLKNQTYTDFAAFLSFYDVQIAVTFMIFLFQLMLFWILWRMNENQQGNQHASQRAISNLRSSI